jgi:hypothetical protein
MRFRDRRHQLAVQAAERNDPSAQALIAEFCELINFPYQQQQGLFAVGFYSSVLPVAPARAHEAEQLPEDEGAGGAPIAPMMAEAAAATYQPVSFDAEAEPAEEPHHYEPAAAAEAPAAGLETHEPEGEHAEPVAAAESPAPAHEEQYGHAPFADESLISEGQVVEGEPSGEEPAHEAHEEGSNGHWHAEREEHAEHAEHNGDEVAPAHEAEHQPVSDVPGRPELDDVLAEHFAPDEEPVVAVRSSGSGIGEVLDAGLVGDDDLDVPLPAELIDEPESLSAHPAEAHEHEQHGEHR